MRKEFFPSCIVLQCFLVSGGDSSWSAHRFGHLCDPGATFGEIEWWTPLKSSLFQNSAGLVCTGGNGTLQHRLAFFRAADAKWHSIAACLQKSNCYHKVKHGNNDKTLICKLNINCAECFCSEECFAAQNKFWFRFFERIPNPQCNLTTSGTNKPWQVMPPLPGITYITYIAWENISRHNTSDQMKWPPRHMASILTTSKQDTLPPWNGRRPGHSKEILGDVALGGRLAIFPCFCFAIDKINVNSTSPFLFKSVYVFVKYFLIQFFL